MLVVHHLGRSQSERIVWLCEELGLDYQLRCYARDPKTILAPADYKALHPIGAAPVITEDGPGDGPGDGPRDGPRDGMVLAESGAIVAYILARHGGGRLELPPEHPGFADYLYWLHFTNGTLQPAMGRCMVLGRLKLAAEDATLLAMRGRLDRAMGLVEARLGAVDYLAGADFTAADIMIVFSLTTMRHFLPLDLGPYPNIRAYLQRIGAREGYRRAMRKGDPEMVPMLA